MVVKISWEQRAPLKAMGRVSLCSCCSAISVSLAAQRYHLIICKGAKVKFGVTKHFSFISILCLYRAFQEMARRPCSEMSFSQWAFLTGKCTGLRGSLSYPSGGFAFYVHLWDILFSPWLKKHLPGQCPFLWHGADTRNSLYVRQMLRSYTQRDFYELRPFTLRGQSLWIPWSEALAQTVPSSF